MAKSLMKIEELLTSFDEWVVGEAKVQGAELVRDVLAHRRALKLKNSVDELYLGRDEVTSFFQHKYNVDRFFELLVQLPDVQAYLLKKGLLAHQSLVDDMRSRSSGGSRSSGSTDTFKYSYTSHDNSSDADYEPSTEPSQSDSGSMTYASSSSATSVHSDTASSSGSSTRSGSWSTSTTDRRDKPTVLRQGLGLAMVFLCFAACGALLHALYGQHMQALIDRVTPVALKTLHKLAEQAVPVIAQAEDAVQTWMAAVQQAVHDGLARLA